MGVRDASRCPRARGLSGLSVGTRGRGGLQGPLGEVLAVGEEAELEGLGRCGEAAAAEGEEVERRWEEPVIVEHSPGGGKPLALS